MADKKKKAKVRQRMVRLPHLLAVELKVEAAKREMSIAQVVALAFEAYREKRRKELTLNKMREEMGVPPLEEFIYL